LAVGAERRDIGERAVERYRLAVCVVLHLLSLRELVTDCRVL
jgi:hypothetical protein